MSGSEAGGDSMPMVSNKKLDADSGNVEMEVDNTVHDSKN